MGNYVGASTYHSYSNWNVLSEGNRFRLQNSRELSNCLDSDWNGSVYPLSCNQGDFQRWYRTNKQWINKATNKCLDSNSDGRVYTLACNGGQNRNRKLF